MDFLVNIIYRTRIEFIDCTEDSNGKGEEAVVKMAHKFSQKEMDVDLEAFYGNACCGMYIQIESEDRKAVERLAGKIVRYINRRKDVQLE